MVVHRTEEAILPSQRPLQLRSTEERRGRDVTRATNVRVRHLWNTLSGETR